MDIEDDSPIDTAFLDAHILIINITCKNLAAFERLIRAVNKSQIKHVLFVSSSSVYQNLNRRVTEDENAENPQSLLYQIESLFRSSTGFDTTVLRFSGLVGPGRHPGRFFRGGKAVRQPAAPINLIHLDDCLGIMDAILGQQAWGETFNGCSDTHPEKRDFYRHVTTMAGMPLPEFIESGELQYKIVSNAKVKAQLAYQFIHPDLMQLTQEFYE